MVVRVLVVFEAEVEVECVEEAVYVAEEEVVDEEEMYLV